MLGPVHAYRTQKVQCSLIFTILVNLELNCYEIVLVAFHESEDNLIKYLS